MPQKCRKSSGRTGNFPEGCLLFFRIYGKIAGISGIAEKLPEKAGKDILILLT